MTIRWRSLPEVPLDPIHPKSSEQTRRLLVELRQAVTELRQTKVAPGPPSNLKVTALAFAVLVQWTQAVNADGTEVLWNTTPSLANAVVIDAGRGQQYVDVVGNSGIKRFYWVRSYDSHSNIRSLEAGPIAATTLAAGMGVTPPAPPPASKGLVIDPLTGQVVNRYGRFQ